MSSGFQQKYWQELVPGGSKKLKVGPVRILLGPEVGIGYMLHVHTLAPKVGVGNFSAQGRYYLCTLGFEAPKLALKEVLF